MFGDALIVLAIIPRVEGRYWAPDGRRGATGFASRAALRHARAMGRALQNRSLDRGLTILGSLSVHGASSLQDLHAHTSLPKSTIRRILGTLIQRKVVRRSLSDQLYRTNISLPLQRKQRIAQSEGWLVDCAVPHMIELTRAAGWSCDLHIFEGRKSRVIESTRPLSPFFQYEREIDLEVPVFASAAGLAGARDLAGPRRAEARQRDRRRPRMGPVPVRDDEPASAREPAADAVARIRGARGAVARQDRARGYVECDRAARVAGPHRPSERSWPCFGRRDSFRRNSSPKRTRENCGT